MKATLMAHMVAGYPDMETSFSIAHALVQGGVSYLEVQFPFSDPTADGPIIQEACTSALETGFTLRKGFSLIEKITEAFTVPVFLMSYGSPVYTTGIDRFIERSKEAGVTGLIVPDLMPGADEGLYRIGREKGMHIVPVVVPSIKASRLETIIGMQPSYLYAALRKGVTGEETAVTETLDFLRRIGGEGPGPRVTALKSSSNIVAGFGIRNRHQVEELQPYVHAVVVGSLFVQTIQESASGKSSLKMTNRIQRVAESLVYGKE